MLSHHLLSSCKCKVDNKELRKQIAILARKLTTETLARLILEAYVSCWLFGDRSVWERFCAKFLGKFIVCVLEEDMQLTDGPLQTATGLQFGAETATHFMQWMFQKDWNKAVILADARNISNSLNKQAALHNIRVIWPQIASALINTYRRLARLIILGASDFYFVKGKT